MQIQVEAILQETDAKERMTSRTPTHLHHVVGESRAEEPHSDANPKVFCEATYVPWYLDIIGTWCWPDLLCQQLTYPWIVCIGSARHECMH